MKLFKWNSKCCRYVKAVLSHVSMGKPRDRVIRALSLLLIVTILAGVVIMPAWAYSSNTRKQEVIYINLNGDGSVDGIYVVNIFDLDDSGRIIDYGDYTELRNMTTNDEIQFDNQTVKIDTNAKKLYYEGKLNSSIIPWIFEIRYYMDGVLYSAKEIAGKSGSLKINMKIRENPACNSTFFKHYALQAAFTLDTNKSSNIVAEGATQANVGSKRQLTYTIMPGKEKDIVITADVTDFEMDAIAINGIALDMDIEIDTENNEDINKLQDGIADLDDGANELNYGAEKLIDGSSDLVDGVKTLRDGVGELKDSINELKDGSEVLYDGVQDLDDGADDLLDGTDDLADGSETLYDGTVSICDGIKGLYDGAKELNDGIKKLSKGAKSLRSGASQMEDGTDELYTGLTKLTDNNNAIESMSNKLYATTLSQYSKLLSDAGYNVTTDSTSEELKTMMEKRQEELTSKSMQENAMPSAIKTRISELNEIAANADGSHTAEETEAANAGIIYWNITMVLQGMDEYQQALEKALEEAGENQEAQAKAKSIIDSKFADVLSEFEALITPYMGASGGDTDAAKQMLMDEYSELSSQIGESEQDMVKKIIIEMLGDSIANDNVYKALAVMSYYKGIIDYTQGVETAASGAGELADGAEDLYEGADELYTGVDSLKDGSNEFLDGIEQLMDGTAELRDGTLELHDGVLTLRDGVITLKDGTKDLVDGVVDLKDGTADLYDGALVLQEGVIALLDGAIELHDGTVKLHDGTVELVDGTLELRDKTSDASLKEKIQKAIDDVLGKDIKTISFTSEKNTNVDFVQFVIKTPKISIEEVKYTKPTPPAQLNFWQKFLSLFGLYNKK